MNNDEHLEGQPESNAGTSSFNSQILKGMKLNSAIFFTAKCYVVWGTVEEESPLNRILLIVSLGCEGGGLYRAVGQAGKEIDCIGL